MLRERHKIGTIEADSIEAVFSGGPGCSSEEASVMEVEISKEDGRVRKLGIPTVDDRIAQTVVKEALEPKVEPLFHRNSYGYRPGRSAHEAIKKARTQCWRCDWVIDLDIKGFFDNMDHQLMMRAVKKHTKEKWVLTYIERWLEALAEEQNGTGREGGPKVRHREEW